MLLFVLLTITAIIKVDSSSPNDVVSLIVLPSKITVYDYVDYFEQVVFWCVNPSVNPSVMENPLQVVWTVNGAELQTDQSIPHFIQEGNKLLINNPSVKDAGSYICTDQGNEDNYAIGILQVNLYPVSQERIHKVYRRDSNPDQTNSTQSILAPIVTSSNNQTGIIGDSGYININITGSYDRIVWRKDDKFLIHWPNPEKNYIGFYDLYNNGTTFKVKRIFVNSNGTYEVAVTNEAGTTYHYPELSIEYPVPVNQSAGNCGKVARCIKCPIEGSDFKRSIAKRSPYPTLEEILELLKKKTWNQPPIAITAPPKCIKAWVGKTVELKCDFVGYPHPYPEWQQMTGSHKFNKKIGNRIVMSIGQSNRKLTIKNIQKRDQNTYYCTGSNSYGFVMFVTRVKVYDYKDFCGTPSKYYRNNRRSKRIVEGALITPKEWPWQAWLSYNPAIWPNPDSFCGGVVIHSKWILTAYHCILKGDIYSDLLPVRDLRIHVGVYNRSVSNEKSRQNFRVKRYYIPENNYNVDKDIALLELKKPIFFSKSVRPICLATSVPLPETECQVSGWGKTGVSKPVSDVLKKAVVPLVHLYECRRVYKLIAEATICAGLPVGGDGTCPGDSGGPLACKRPGENQWDLIGLVSGGKGCGNGYTYYSNVVDNRQWIIDTTGIDF